MTTHPSGAAISAPDSSTARSAGSRVTRSGPTLEAVGRVDESEVVSGRRGGDPGLGVGPHHGDLPVPLGRTQAHRGQIGPDDGEGRRVPFHEGHRGRTTCTASMPSAPVPAKRSTTWAPSTPPWLNRMSKMASRTRSEVGRTEPPTAPTTGGHGGLHRSHAPDQPTGRNPRFPLRSGRGRAGQLALEQELGFLVVDEEAELPDQQLVPSQPGVVVDQ